MMHISTIQGIFSSNTLFVVMLSALPQNMKTFSEHSLLCKCSAMAIYHIQVNYNVLSQCAEHFPLQGHRRSNLKLIHSDLT